jgi:hypothetical protein
MKSETFSIEGCEPLHVVMSDDGLELVGVSAPRNMLPQLQERYKGLLEAVMRNEQAKLDNPDGIG